MTSAPRSASIMPAHGPVMNVPCSTTRMPFNTPPIGDELRGSFMARRESCRSFSVVVDGGGAGMRQNESDGAHLLLEQMRDESCGARQNGDALERAERIAGIEQHGRDRARYVQRERLAEQIRQQALHVARNLDVRSGRAGFG